MIGNQLRIRREYEMEKHSKKESALSLILMIVILVGVWKGPELFQSVKSNHRVVETDTVQAAATSSDEVRAVWISFLDFESAKVDKKSEKQFRKYVDTMFNKCVSAKLNTVIVQVRPLSDAMYSSEIFPWSKVISGKQGRNPGYDPLEYMVEAAHKRNLKIEAWLNPYRITLSSIKFSSLSASNPAVKWKKSSNSSERRNVLKFGGQYYYNPAKTEVRQLIVDGVREIVHNYDVDGIHFDDYFYPALGNKYKSLFDAKEYKSYKSSCKKNGEDAKSIVAWRRENVNKLLKGVYSAIKDIDSNVKFGVSPAGNINNLYGSDRYYCDVKKWLSSDGYVDYICPQIYWSFTQPVCPYTKTLKKWCNIKKNSKIDLYVGLAAYRAGISKKEARMIGDSGWGKSRKILKKQVVTARKLKKVSGFALFRYDNIVSSKTKKEMKNLKSVLK